MRTRLIIEIPPKDDATGAPRARPASGWIVGRKSELSQASGMLWARRFGAFCRENWRFGRHLFGPLERQWDASHERCASRLAAARVDGRPRSRPL